MRATLAIVAVIGLSMPIAASAQSLPKLKPGAWEITSMHDGNDMRGMEEMLAKMPPQVRDMMQKKMTQGPTSSVMKHCATPNDEAFAADMQAMMGANVKCSNTNIRQSGSTYTWTSSCAGEMMPGRPFRSDSDHTVSLQGSDAFSHKSVSRTSGGPMGATSRTSTTQGRFLGADCKSAGALTLEERMQSMGAAGERPRRRERPAPQ